MIEAQSAISVQQGSSARKYALIITLLVISVALMGVIFVLLEKHTRESKTYLAATAEQRLLSRSIVALALDASRGSPKAFKQLQESRNRFDEILALQKTLDGADSRAAGQPPPENSIAFHVETLESQWKPIRADVNKILEGRDSVLLVSESIREFDKQLPGILTNSQEVAKSLADGGAPAGQVFHATYQMLLAQRIGSSLNRMLTGGPDPALAADQFGSDVVLFKQVLQGLLRGDAQLRVDRITNQAVIAKLNQINELFRAIEEDVSAILRSVTPLYDVQKATQAITKQEEEKNGLIEANDRLLQAFEAEANSGFRLFGLNIDYKYAYGCGLLALLLLLVLTWEISQDVKHRLLESEQRKQKTEEQNRRNQEAILRLLDELGDLAEGDLTVRASVTEDITGAIADSFNYAIEALRGLVSTINNTSELVASAAQETRAVADRLARASEVQARQIESASATVMQMAQSMDEAAAKTSASAEVAEKSVSIAQEGGDRVRRTMQGMDVIREHIQETSKRIKRLGESSQEIGDIVALINDIADQTNILALNAAIQASAAGEAGRGFAVVADEVQRLAERSSSATKRIEALVKTIQADTNEAIISMEKSTTEVVNGAGLAEKAGAALDEIESVSARLAELITDVSKAARQVTEMAARVSAGMKSINEITAQTSESSRATASSIGKLNQLAQELQQSVAGFRLPEQPAGTP